MKLETGIRTICAPATPVGHGGIAVVRLSGPESEVVARQLCPFLPATLESHRVYYGKLRAFKKDEVVDEVLVSFFEQGRSFTGETTFEISAHGSQLIVDEIQQNLIRAGAQLAQPGEFTFQAFLNNRIDLVQAESVLSLIESQSKIGKQISLNQLVGQLSQTYAEIEDSLTWALAHLEANIDFSEENLETVSNNELLIRVKATRAKVGQLAKSYDQGRVIRSGLQIALVGSPNVGKSSVFNRLVEMDRSIVTDVAGTTRDSVSESAWLQGLQVEFVDTAGLRDAKDQVETLGIERSKKVMSDSTVVLWVIDASRDLTDEDLLARKNLKEQKVFVLLNKCDLVGDMAAELRREFAGSQNIPIENIFCVSATKNEGFSELKEQLADSLKVELSESQSIVLQSRQYEDLLKMEAGLVEALREMENPGSSPEFIALGLRTALQHALRIRGKQFDEEVIDRVFKEFCLGK